MVVGSASYGFLYFLFYKGIKMHANEHLKDHSPMVKGALYASASTIAEIIALTVYYPFELIKVRLVTKNH